MSVTLPCRSCIPFNCSGFGTDGDPFSLYSLQQPPFLFVFNCPPGYACQDAPFLLLDCCGQRVVVDLIGVVEPQRTQKIQAALSACANRWEFCEQDVIVTPPSGPGVPPTIKLFFNGMATCQIACLDGTVFTIQVAPGGSCAPSQAAADALALSYACELAGQRRICLGNLSLASGCVSQAFNATISAQSARPVTFSLSGGSLPTGLSLSQLNSFVGKISGVPSTGGTFNFSIRAVNAAGNFMEKAYSISILAITPTTLPDGTTGSAYFQQLNSTGGTGAVSYSIAGGALPNGVTLSGAGLLQGTPTSGGDFLFTVQFTDSVGLSCQLDYDLHVDAAVCPSVVGSFVAGGAQVTNSANDVALGRVLASVNSVGNTKLLNAQSGSIISNSITNAPGSWARWHPGTQRFVYSPETVGAKCWRTVSAAGAETTTGDATDLYGSPCYDWDSDLFYGAGFDGGIPTVYFTTFNPNTDLVVGKLNVGLPTGGVPDFLYASTPKCVGGMDTFEVLTRYSLPGFVAGPTIDFSVAPYSQLKTGVENRVTGTWFAVVFRADSRELCVEIDPATMTVINTYDMGAFNGGLATSIASNPSDGFVYAKGTAGITVIDGPGHSIFCSVNPGANHAGLSYDRFTGRLFIANFSTGNITYLE